jgi:hypothetical protein
MLSSSYLLQGKPFNEVYNTKWRIWSWVEKEIKLDKVEHKWNWMRLVEALMSTIKLLGDDKARRSNWKVSRWISCPAQKGKPLLNNVIVSWVVQLKNTSSSWMCPCCVSFEKTKVPFSYTTRSALLMKVYNIYKHMLILNSHGCKKFWWNSNNICLFCREFEISAMQIVDDCKLWMNFEVTVL